jgi:hypothetical protein
MQVIEYCTVPSAKAGEQSPREAKVTAKKASAFLIGRLVMEEP